MRSFFNKLSHSLGPRQAAIEIKWMRQVAHAPHDLSVMLNRRAHGEPLQYILGTQPFGPLNLLIRKPTLIPRPETEQWTSNLADMLKMRAVVLNRPLNVLDLCTGSGCIPLLLCHLLNIQDIQLTALGIDISQSACELARENIALSNLSPTSSLDIRRKSLFDDDFWQFVEGAFHEPTLHRIVTESELPTPFQLDVITANPPYIPNDQWHSLPLEVKNWEDPAALLGDPLLDNGNETKLLGNKGLTFYERIRDLISTPKMLSHQCLVAMEVGDGQADDVVKIFDGRFSKIEVWQDLWGKERAVFLFDPK
ncbi:S-adenosyl-L-methionine-dependent methyltransferase [Ramaria rubella]|nr:S-adenosyl-L-methionine-dependent methyltransferase [Ramaria rubella]